MKKKVFGCYDKKEGFVVCRDCHYFPFNSNGCKQFREENKVRLSYDTKNLSEQHIYDIFIEKQGIHKPKEKELFLFLIWKELQKLNKKLK